MSVSDISPFLPDQDPSRKLSHEHVDAHQYDYRVVQRVRNGSVIDVEVSRDPGVSDLSLYAQRAVLWTLQKR